MKNLSKKIALALCALMVCAPLTCSAAFGIKLPGGINIGKKGGGGGSVAATNKGVHDNRHCTGSVTADGAALGYAHIYNSTNPAASCTVSGGKVIMSNGFSKAGMTDDKGKIDVAIVNGKMHTIVIWKTGFHPIVLKNVLAPANLGALSTYADGDARGLQFNN